MSWTLDTDVESIDFFTKIVIETEVLCSLKGRETFYLKFKNPMYITDNIGNPLSTTEITAQALKNNYMDSKQKAVVQGAGTAFSGTSIATLAFVIGMNMIQSAAVGSFWAFINMLQMLSYLPMIDCDIPQNLVVFLTQYMTVGKVSLPFDMMPSWIPNPLAYLPTFLTDPFNGRFSLCGYATLSFIYNFADQLTTWCLLLAFYIALCILTKWIPESS